MTAGGSRTEVAGVALRLAVAMALLPLLLAPAAAQTIPEGQSCGGLFCDLGIVGHKVAPAALLAAPAPSERPAEPPAGQRVEGTPPARRQAARRKAPAAKAGRAPVDNVLASKAPAKLAAVPATPSPAARAPVATTAASPTAPPPSRPGANSVINPYATPQASPFAFPSIYPPAVGVQ